MQLTLVSHYGSKPPAFATLLGELQAHLRDSLGRAFIPYDLAQIHGTIIGLEGQRLAGEVHNENFRRLRQRVQPIDFARLTSAARSMDAFQVRVGGFSERSRCDFVSNGRPPHERSFSIQGEIAVAMGWPWQDGRYSERLVDFRKALEQCGVLHKWHRNEADRDNDFFFVLGRIDAAIATAAKAEGESRLRRMLATRYPLELNVSSDTLAFVAYDDPRLPLSTSRVLAVNDPATTAEALRDLY